MKTLILSDEDASLMADVINQGMMKGFEFPPNSPTKELFQYWIAFLQGQAKTSTMYGKPTDLHEKLKAEASLKPRPGE